MRDWIELVMQLAVVAVVGVVSYSFGLADVAEDCRMMGSFRVSGAVYLCQRK
jgi:predicted phosphohydrolase